MTKESYVNHLYEVLLERKPDENGYAHHLRALGADPTFEQAVVLLEDFLRSNEYRRKITQRKNRLHISSRVEVISVGSHCITSAALKKYGLKNFSSPFDWVFSNFDMVAHCLSDGFSTFLDRTMHVSVPVEAREVETANFCDHAFYLNRCGIKYIFNHRDVTEDGHYQYYVRCVDRMMSSLLDDKPTLLVGVASSISESAFLKITDQLSRFSNVSLLAIEFNNKISPLSVRKKVDDGTSVLYEVASIERLGATAFKHHIDERLFISILESRIRWLEEKFF